MSVQTWRVLVGDVRETLRELPDGCVQTCVTSPPYWGLRDYGTGRWEGGDTGCVHIAPATGPTQNKGNAGRMGTPFRDVCGLCGAARIDSQIGLEGTPDDFVAALVDVFREVKRVLRDDGTLWMNLGDSYLAQQGAGFNGQKRLDHANRNVKVARPEGMKPKDLAGDSVDGGVRAQGGWLVSAERHYLAQAEPDAGERHRPTDQEP